MKPIPIIILEDLSLNSNPVLSYQSRNMIKTHIVTKITQLNVKRRSVECQLCLRFAYI